MICVNWLAGALKFDQLINGKALKSNFVSQTLCLLKLAKYFAITH